jgi:hypothetical protein
MKKEYGRVSDALASDRPGWLEGFLFQESMHNQRINPIGSNGPGTDYLIDRQGVTEPTRSDKS